MRLRLYSIPEEGALKNIDTYNEALIEKLRRKDQLPARGGLEKGGICNKIPRLTGLSGSGG
jgi:hypothetical protein